MEYIMVHTKVPIWNLCRFGCPEILMQVLAMMALYVVLDGCWTQTFWFMHHYHGVLGYCHSGSRVRSRVLERLGHVGNLR